MHKCPLTRRLPAQSQGYQQFLMNMKRVINQDIVKWVLLVRLNDTGKDTQASNKENPPRPMVNLQNLSNQKTAWLLPSGKVDIEAEPHSCTQKKQASWPCHLWGQGCVGLEETACESGVLDQCADSKH